MDNGQQGDASELDAPRPDATSWWYPTRALLGGQEPSSTGDPELSVVVPAARPDRSRGGAVLRAANAQNDWAPAARAAVDSMASAAPLYRVLIGIARTSSLRP